MSGEEGSTEIPVTRFIVRLYCQCEGEEQLVGSQFESSSGTGYPEQCFHGYPKAKLGQCNKIGQHCFLPWSIQFIIHNYFIISLLIEYSVVQT